MRSIFARYLVRRMDGDPKHDKCLFWVLDLSCDPYAVAAMESYAAACKLRYPKLAAQLEERARAIRDLGITDEEDDS